MVFRVKAKGVFFVSFRIGFRNVVRDVLDGTKSEPVEPPVR